MPSPFPGMHPYLESPDVWPGFHNAYMVDLARALVPRLTPKYVVRTEHMLFLHELSAEDRRYFARADAAIMDAERGVPDGTRTPRGAVASPSALAQAPLRVVVPTAVDIERHVYLEVRDRASRRVVTVVELLSPSNKHGDDRLTYLSKLKELTSAGANLVEIDLLRAGHRVEQMPACDYCVTVGQNERMPEFGVWPIGLRERLPTIPVPLAGDDPPVALDLQAALHQTYDLGGYADDVYGSPPDPPLSAADQAWADEVRAAV